MASWKVSARAAAKGACSGAPLWRGAATGLTLLCLGAAASSDALAADARLQDIQIVNRLTWGANVSSVAEFRRLGRERWLEAQLHPPTGDDLPPAALAQIRSLRIASTPMAELAVDMDAANKAANQIKDPDQKKIAQQSYNQAISDLSRQAAQRSLLRDLYSRDQVLEQMTWFWVNHFNVFQNKRDIRTMIGDFEDQAIRPHALGRFRDLLEATVRHPAMLRYLDNDQNASGHLNENYARELMELHTLGVGSGYTQADVQELARILTGVGVDLSHNAPPLKPEVRPLYVRAGLFEFNPARHDFGDKVLLGHGIKGSGFSEVEQALDILAASPATARHLSFEIAAYFMGDRPDPATVDRLSAIYLRSDGDIAKVLAALFRSPAFEASLGREFKDPVHYAVSSVRLAYDDQVILNTGPVQTWLSRMAESLYGRETPDGYPLAAAAWNGPGQLAVRFDLARQIGAGSAGLFRSDPKAADLPAFPELRNALYYQGLGDLLAQPTKAVLGQAVSPEEWNALFLSSPEFMNR